MPSSFLSVRLPELHGLYVLGVRPVSCADANETTAGCAAGVLLYACMCVRPCTVCVCLCVLRVFSARLASGEVERWRRSESVH